jgi:hypothetical protein
VTDLRAERRAIAARLYGKGIKFSKAQMVADYVVRCPDIFTVRGILDDLDNPPELAAFKESLTTEGWTHHETRLPTEADAPDGYILVCDDYGFLSVDPLAGYLSGNGNRNAYPYWHPATGQHQIPKAPEAGCDKG